MLFHIHFAAHGQELLEPLVFAVFLVRLLASLFLVWMYVNVVSGSGNSAQAPLVIPSKAFLHPNTNSGTFGDMQSLTIWFQYVYMPAI